MKPGSSFSRALAAALALLLLPASAPSARKPQQGNPAGNSGKPAPSSPTPARKAPVKRPPWYVPTYADSTKNDVAEYDDPVVREVAVEALGRLNGSVVAVDPNTGRILSVVNQKVAFAAGFQPCSTIKPVIGVAGLQEGVITRDTMIKVAPRRYMNLTEAMATSNNPYFEVVGRQLGFEKVARYARLLGLGEPAGYNIPEEQGGVFPAAPPAPGGVGRMASFGEGIRITPLQLASLVSTLANGGTVYYLQYPRTDEERQGFAPRIKRKLELEPLLPDLREGMLAAVLYGTARSSFDPDADQLLGKTGTCSAEGSRLGWFVAYADQLRPRVVLVVLLRGSARTVNGHTAADIAGRIYHRLHERNYFAGARSRDAVAAGSSH
jgi:cell division protein FtsI/penicillin-binding protein 2